MEIRRIQDTEGAEVARLWDAMCREPVDGGPLSEAGVRNIARMLSIAAWHQESFCLVAEDAGRPVGFVCGDVTAGSGLLPGLVCEIEGLYVVPDARRQGVGRGLVEAALSYARDRGAGLARLHACVDDATAHAFWRRLGFEPDMVAFSRYDLA